MDTLSRMGYDLIEIKKQTYTTKPNRVAVVLVTLKEILPDFENEITHGFATTISDYLSSAEREINVISQYHIETITKNNADTIADGKIVFSRASAIKRSLIMAPRKLQETLKPLSDKELNKRFEPVWIANQHRVWNWPI